MNDTLAETNGRAIIYRVTDRSYHVQWKLSVMAGHQSARITRKTGRKKIHESALHKSFQFLAPTSLLITSPPFKLAAIQLHIPSAATRTNRLGHSATSESLQKPKNEASMMRRKRQEGCSYQMAACWPRAHTHTHHAICMSHPMTQRRKASRKADDSITQSKLIITNTQREER